VRRSHLALVGVAMLAVVVGVVTVVRTVGACAAVAADRTGRATYYGNAAPGGACSFPTPPADHLTTAAGPADYAQAAACGGYLQVTGRRSTIVVKVDNLCPECEPGHLDLSTEAFARLDALGAGVTPISFHQVVDPPLTAGLSFRVKEGSSQWWLALLVDGHGNPLRSVEVSADGGRSWKSLTRTDYNYWLAAGGAGPGPFRVRVTDLPGHSAVVDGIAIRPGTVQTTSVHLYGPLSGGGAVPPASTRTPSTRAPSTPAPSTGTASSGTVAKPAAGGATTRASSPSSRTTGTAVRASGSAGSTTPDPAGPAVASAADPAATTMTSSPGPRAEALNVITARC